MALDSALKRTRFEWDRTTRTWSYVLSDERERGLRGVDLGIELNGTRTTADMIFEAALQGDRAARTVVHDLMVQLGPVVAVLASAFHPRYIVVGGESENTIRCLAGELADAVRDRTLPELAESIKVLEGQESGALALVGAGLMVFEQAIADGPGKFTAS